MTLTNDVGSEVRARFRFVVVYDPTGGFVTGGGWIHPDDGSVYPGMDAADKVSLGFNVKYLPNSTNPQGKLNVQLGDMHVHSDAINWLVITIENESHFSGTATIDNGTELFPFRVNLFDGDADVLPDRFELLVFAPGADPYYEDPLYRVTGDVQQGQVKIQRN